MLRYAFALLGCVALCLIAVVSYAIVIGTYDARHNDWSCPVVQDDSEPPCLDINYWR